VTPPAGDAERARAEAREAVHGRLALASCALWTFGVLLLVFLVPDDAWIGASTCRCTPVAATCS
jgi:hypothetical protein